MLQKSLSILFINPWQGVIGPNIGMGQIVGECLARGHMVYLLTLARDEYSTKVDELGATILVCPEIRLTPRTLNPLRLFPSMVRDWQFARRLGQLGRDFDVDLVCMNGENMLFAPRAGIIAGCPSVVFVRGNRFVALGIVGIAYFWLQRRCVSKYIGNSYSTGNRLRAMGVKKSMIQVAELGVDVNRFAPGKDTPQTLREFGVTSETKIIGAVGHLTHRKGMHYLVDAFCRIISDAPNTLCFIFGGISRNPSDHRYLAEIHKRIADEELENRLIFMGNRSDLADLLPRMDVVVHPSESESFGRSVAEAMACGRPVVGFDVEAVNELVVDGITGLLVPPFDIEALSQAILRLLNDRDLGEMMGGEGRRRVIEKYSLTNTNRRLVDYMEIIAKQEVALKSVF